MVKRYVVAYAIIALTKMNPNVDHNAGMDPLDAAQANIAIMDTFTKIEDATVVAEACAKGKIEELRDPTYGVYKASDGYSISLGYTDIGGNPTVTIYDREGDAIGEIEYTVNMIRTEFDEEDPKIGLKGVDA